jgi:hypothetical protein
LQAEGRNNHANMECVPAVCYTAFLSLALTESEYRSLAARAHNAGNYSSHICHPLSQDERQIGLSTRRLSIHKSIKAT